MSGIPGMPMNRRRILGSCVCPTCAGAGTVSNAPPSIAFFNEQYLSKGPGLVLGYLMARAGNLVRRDELMTVCWGDHDDPPLEKVVDVYLVRIRRVLERSPATLETVWGRGWILRAPAPLVNETLARAAIDACAPGAPADSPEHTS